MTVCKTAPPTLGTLLHFCFKEKIPHTGDTNSLDRCGYSQLFKKHLSLSYYSFITHPTGFVGSSLGAPSSTGWLEQRDCQPESLLPGNCLFLLDWVFPGGEGCEAERQRVQVSARCRGPCIIFFCIFRYGCYQLQIYSVSWMHFFLHLLISHLLSPAAWLQVSCIPFCAN